MSTSLPLWPLAVVLAAALLAMGATWWLQRHTRNAGYVDVVWAAGIGAAALFFGSVGSGAGLPRLLVALFGGLWGLRLSLHLLARVLGEAEDGRYAHLRAHWRDDQRKWFAFFVGQALLVALFSLPLLVAASNPTMHWNGWLWLAVAIWLLAQLGEWIADRQLAQFRADRSQRGRTCRRGLWRYSRHPNYFFEWLHWFAYVLLAIGAPRWWLSLAGPVLMLAFLYRLTGIPWTEQQALRSRGEAYRRYQREVSPFIPWPPRRPRN